MHPTRLFAPPISGKIFSIFSVFFRLLVMYTLSYTVHKEANSYWCFKLFKTNDRMTVDFISAQKT